MAIIVKILLVILMAVMGVVPIVYMTLGMPVVLIWKIYRSVRYHISFWD